MSIVNLAWRSAEVEEGTLTVALEGDPPKDWKQSFERTVALLGDGDWGEIRLKKGAVRVTKVAPGTEDKLRHHLESVVAQANAAHEREEAKAHNEDHDGELDEGNDDGGGDERRGPDAEMTERFRAFAEPQSQSGD